MSCFLLLMIFFLFLLLPSDVNSVSFNFTDFEQNIDKINFEGDAFQSKGILQLTKNELGTAITNSTGRASYSEPIRLWDNKTGRLTDFTTHFSFILRAVDPSKYGDGISFFIAPFDSELPSNSSGGFLALFNSGSAFDPSRNSIVAVEFDSKLDPWDPSSDHVGINVNSIISKENVTWRSSIKNGSLANAWISYNSSAKNLSVFLTYADKPVYDGNSTLSYVVDLRTVLPEWVRIGFSAATGEWIEVHNILSWSFDSSLDSKGNQKVGLVIGLVVGLGFLCCALGVFWFTYWKKRVCWKKQETDLDASINDEFEKGTGPKRFTYKELSRGTNNFGEEGKLGEGGFGGVYKGLLGLGEKKIQVAVKRVSRGSKQGKKEYISEVKIISRLRHRNLVQLLGWCHEKGEFLLVYEFMSNGSLDFHLFGGKTLLTWTVRYKIALGLASSLLYLHEEWEQCVVHRDIKSSNVMLDTNFNAKLGDFGLARLVDHELGSQTTVLAGTMGYLAPECVTTGKASKESDVYSFGVVALEITCGRRPVEAKAEPGRVRLIEWVWNLYGKGQILEASDSRLEKEFNEREMECLMIVGLWCCHPDPSNRPSIRQVINVLNFEAPLPSLPPMLPVPMYYAPPIEMCRFSYTSSGMTSSDKDRMQCSCSSCSTAYSSVSAASRKALLNSQRI